MEARTLFQKLTWHKAARIIMIPMYCALICACSNQQLMGQGTVITEKQLAPVNRSSETAIGAMSGASLGSIIGALTGAAAGAGCAAITFGLCAPAIPGMVISGAATGGGIGGVSGAGVGYVTGSYRQGKGFYQYTVNPDFNDNSPITVEQYSKSLMPPGTRVLIYQTGKANGNEMFRIEPINKTRPTPVITHNQ